MNQSPTLFLIGARMELAARLLKETLLTISEIAERSGYYDLYYFSKSFKNTIRSVLADIAARA